MDKGVPQGGSMSNALFYMAQTGALEVDLPRQQPE
jgi:hypothetical protein